jgi:hypothetical protein
MKTKWIANKRVTVYLIFFVITGLILGLVYFFSDFTKTPAQASRVVSVQLMSLPSQARTPSSITSNGNTLFWVDTRNYPTTDVREYRISTAQESVLSSSGNPYGFIQCNNNYVVWNDMRANNPGIYGYNLTTQQEFFIRARPTTATEHITSTFISQDHFFWVEGLNIMGYRFADQQTLTVSIGQNSQWSVQQGNSIVAWEILSEDNMMVKKIAYRDLVSQVNYDFLFDPLLTTSAMNVYDDYLGYYSRDDLSTMTPTGIINFYNTQTHSITRSVPLTHQNNRIATIKGGITLATHSTDLSLMAIVSAVSKNHTELEYHPYLVDPKFNQQDPPVITPIVPSLPIGEVIQDRPYCPANAIDQMFLFHSAKTDFHTNLSFYDFQTNTVYPIITDNTAASSQKPIKINNTIVYPFVLKGTETRKSIPKYVLVTLKK